MRYILISLLLILSFIPYHISGQASTENTPLMLEKLYGRLIINNDDNERIAINDSIKSIIDSYVRSDSIFYHRFDNLKYLGQIISPDSLLKVVTWNLLLRKSPSQYYCYFIRKKEEGSKNLIYSLAADYKEESIRTDTIYNEKNWYGALYYDLKPITDDSSKLWILLGVDYGNMYISRKIIEVLSFTQSDSIRFGKKWFDDEENFKYREVFGYASNGMMSVRFYSDKSIVFDHLVPFSPELKDDRQYYGPDYSYDAYNFENGLWKLFINVDARNKE